MKTIFKFTWVIGALLFLSACSSNTPSAVVEKALDCVVSEDYKGYVDLMQLTEDNDPQVKEEAKKEFAEMIEKQAAKQGDKEKLKSYEILKEEFSKTGTYARVTFKEVYMAGDEHETSLYLVKDKEGKWVIMLWGADRLMDE
ncbi:nuclear transport factor 2 family protein [Bacteroides mediterraneensis]|uniref:DUF4878 domain-containing protein n=1 Tax=Bacteroides mediterraneensis TaxID=1841856 RepID=UPI00137B2E68|nr:DUF4878 domain-containing protein [Bacteroides mediterraneensis]